ncbi:MAG: DNA mismatch repair protein MutS, partial [Flavobacteriales bacterium]|nr:DNA mismatch repair protein MutS [Flavobacteriales bacterium]
VLTKSAQEAARYANVSISEYDKKKEKYEERLKRQQESIERNNKYLNHGKKLIQFIEKYNLKGKNKELLDEIRKYIAMEKTASEESKKEKRIRKQLDKDSERELRKSKNVEIIKAGSLVRLRQTRQTGTVLEIDGTHATVAFGNFKTLVDVGKLDWIR